jgi:dTDP-4-amino-4,6-dideoxygalactose transaminase
MNQIPLLRPELPPAETVLPYLRRIDSTGWYTNFGPLVRELEQRLCKRFTAQSELPVQVTTVSNCTTGLELALRALGLRPGMRVLIPALTFVATANAVVSAGCHPVVADVSPGSWLLTPQIAESAAERFPFDAVIPVATFGRGQDVNAWDQFASRTRIPVVIDAAGAFDNQLIGRCSCVVFSLHATKPFAAGEGGIVATADDALRERVRKMSNFGINPDSGTVDYAGTNAKLSEYHAALGLASLAGWERSCRRRRYVTSLYERALARNCPDIESQERPPGELLSILTIALPEDADPVNTSDYLLRRGIETRRWYYPLIPGHAAFRSSGWADDLSTSRALSERLLGLPFHTALSAEQIDHVTRELRCAIDRISGQGRRRALPA